MLPSKKPVSNGVRLLIVTQTVDKNSQVLGFFHRWIGEFAKQFEGISVICLFEGEHALPANVRVYSLGKESVPENSMIYHTFSRRISYVVRFWKLIWHLRHEYDSVLVHMNQEYVLLGVFPWKLMHKHIYMWRNHYAGSLFTRLAVAFSHKVFCTSKHSYTARFKKTVLMPVGIDTDMFHEDASLPRDARSILSLGRIAPSKHIDVLIEALHLLSRSASFTADIYGDALPQDAGYLEKLKRMVADYGLGKNVIFHGGVANHATPAVYRSHRIFVNTSQSGMYDKTIFEAAACGCLVLASSRDFAELFGASGYFAEGNSEELAHKLEGYLTAETSVGEGSRGIVSSHSLRELGKALADRMM